MQETCATCGAPFQPDGLRGTEYVCPFCGKTHPISPEAEKALRQQRDLEQARSFLRQRRFADAGALYQALSLSLPEEAEVWEGLLLSSYRCASAEELAQARIWSCGERTMRIVQTIEKLDAGRGARLRRIFQEAEKKRTIPLLKLALCLLAIELLLSLILSLLGYM